MSRHGSACVGASDDPARAGCSLGRVDVVIVAHNAGDLLLESVGSAVEQAGVDHVFVMDAESSDASIENLRSVTPDVRVTSVPNLGFAASNNRGFELGSADYVMLLNPDARLEPGALDRLVDTADSLPAAGIVAPAVVNPNGSIQAGSYGRFPTLPRQMALKGWTVFSKVSGNTEASPPMPSAPTLVDWVTGAAMLVRRAAIRAAGPMDEAFFMYYEDIEWCHRMWDNQWEVVLEPRARAVHHLGKSDAPGERVQRAYRDSFCRYADLYGLWGLKALGAAGSAVRRSLGGRG